MASSRFSALALITLCSAALVVACGDDGDGSGSGGSGTGMSTGGGGTGGTGTGTGGAGTGGTGTGTGGMVPFEVTSNTFAEGETIPTEVECGPPIANGPGMNVSPDLTWTPGPAGTQSYAVVVRDIDAMIPQFPEGIIHWVIYDIPAATLSLPQGLMANYDVAEIPGAKQAELQGSGYFGFFGPCSPNSINTYVWTVHAMPEATVPGVSMASTESEIAAAIESTSIAQVSLSGES
ncbi:MAG: YbhB/YbcL family Raf kinase inhibitor-like protein [Polyangiaceae bacterium]